MGTSQDNLGYAVRLRLRYRKRQWLGGLEAVHSTPPSGGSHPCQCMWDPTGWSPLQTPPTGHRCPRPGTEDGGASLLRPGVYGVHWRRWAGWSLTGTGRSGWAGWFASAFRLRKCATSCGGLWPDGRMYIVSVSKCTRFCDGRLVVVLNVERVGQVQEFVSIESS